VHDSSSSFFSFLLGETLREVMSITVTVPDGTWALSDSLLFRLGTGELHQIVVELDGQDAVRLRDEHDMRVSGDYADLIERRAQPIVLPDAMLPDEVVSIVEFQSIAGKLVGAEIQLAHGAFSVLLYPEDVEVRRFGAIWEFVREHGLPQLHELTVRQVASDAIR
jgi:hypothetical protein